MATKDSSSASRHMKGGTRFDADELEAVVRVFELLVKWDDELQAKATASAPDKDMATSEPMKVVGGAE